MRNYTKVDMLRFLKFKEKNPGLQAFELIKLYDSETPELTPAQKWKNVMNIFNQLDLKENLEESTKKKGKIKKTPFLENLHGNPKIEQARKFQNTPGVELIKQEREEQIIKHGRTTELDIKYNADYQLALAAENLCSPVLDVPNYMAPRYWDEEIWDKMTSKPYKERLIIAGALIAAEIDRLTAIGE